MAQNSTGTLNWGAVAGAVDYHVDVLDPPGDMNSGGVSLNGSPTSGGSLSMPNSTVFGSLLTGTYHLQVRALAADPSDHAPWSDPVTVNWQGTLDPVDSTTINFT